MLPKTHRLPRPQFPLVLKHGTKLNSLYFTLFYIPTAENNPRFGIIVSAKVSKSAVNRNLLKRRLRHAVMSAIPDLKSPLDAILLAKPGSLNQTMQVFVKELRHTFSQLS